METQTIFRTVGGVVLGLLGLLIIGFWGAVGGALLGAYFGPTLVRKFLDAK